MNTTHSLEEYATLCVAEACRLFVFVLCLCFDKHDVKFALSKKNNLTGQQILKNSTLYNHNNKADIIYMNHKKNNTTLAVRAETDHGAQR